MYRWYQFTLVNCMVNNYYCQQNVNHQLKALEVAFNNILRKIWKLPYRCHTGILTTSFLHKACSSQNLLIRHVFQSCSKLVYTFTGYNSAYNNKLYNDSDSEIAGFVRDMHLLPQNFNVDNNTLDSIIFQLVVHSLGSFPSYFTLLFLYLP